MVGADGQPSMAYPMVVNELVGSEAELAVAVQRLQRNGSGDCQEETTIRS